MEDDRGKYRPTRPYSHLEKEQWARSSRRVLKWQKTGLCKRWAGSGTHIEETGGVTTGGHQQGRGKAGLTGLTERAKAS